MTYKESLKQAFLKTDSEEADYESGIFPILANEAQMFIAMYGTPIVKCAEISADSEPFRFGLPKDFYKVHTLGLVFRDDTDTGADFRLLEDGVLEIPKTGEYVFYYCALPKDLNSLEDLDDYEYEVAPETHIAIPAYIGYQLVKTDDVQLAQILKNEWDKYMSLFDVKTKAVKRKISNIARW